MKTTLAVALAALTAACSSEKQQKPIEYGAPAPLDSAQAYAIGNAAATLQGSIAYQPSTEPTAGAVGLADQLAAELGGQTTPQKTATPGAAKLAQRAISQAFDTGGGTIDPACVLPPTTQDGVTTYTWSGCVIDLSQPDTGTGDALTMQVTIDGWLKWNEALGQTTWKIGEGLAMTMTSTTTSGLETFSMNGTVDLEGTLTVGSTTIDASTTSSSHVRTSVAGGPYGTMTFDEDLLTTLLADLDYQADPFCITGGTMRVEQRANMAGYEDGQGWDFAWTGCGAVEVRTGVLGN